MERILIQIMRKHTKNSSNHSEQVQAKPLSRRDFFGQTWKWLGILAVVEVIGMCTAFLFSGKAKKTEVRKQLLEAGPVNSFANNSVTAFAGGRFYLARQNDGGFIALSLRCTHLGCSVNWEESQKRFVCPCHSSMFDMSGEVLNAPATRALDYYPVVIENDLVKVDVGTIIERNSYRKDQLQYA
jgi:cytochrome b6-f complex iron-sulfur subunit